MQRGMAAGKRPPFAPPFLVHGSVVVAQVAAILHYLAPQIGLVPDDEGSRLWCHQIQLTITDFVAEVHDTHHPLGPTFYYEDQKPEALRRTEAFLAERVPKYLGWLERITEQNGSGPHLVGDSLTYPDLSVFQLLEGLHYAFPKAWRSLRTAYPRLIAVHDAVERQQGVAGYLRSERRITFNVDGIFRHYPELDG